MVSINEKDGPSGTASQQLQCSCSSYRHNLYQFSDPSDHSLPVNMLEAAKRLDHHHAQRKEPLTPGMFKRLHYELMCKGQSLDNVRTMVFIPLGYCGFKW